MPEAFENTKPSIQTIVVNSPSMKMEYTTTEEKKEWRDYELPYELRNLLRETAKSGEVLNIIITTQYYITPSEEKKE